MMEFSSHPALLPPLVFSAPPQPICHIIDIDPPRCDAVILLLSAHATSIEHHLLPHLMCLSKQVNNATTTTDVEIGKGPRHNLT